MAKSIAWLKLGYLPNQQKLYIGEKLSILITSQLSSSIAYVGSIIRTTLNRTNFCKQMITSPYRGSILRNFRDSLLTSASFSLRSTTLLPIVARVHPLHSSSFRLFCTFNSRSSFPQELELLLGVPNFPPRSDRYHEVMVGTLQNMVRNFHTSDLLS